MNYTDPSEECSETYTSLKGAGLISSNKDGYNIWMTVLARLTSEQMTSGLDYAVNHYEGRSYLKPAQFIAFARGKTDGPGGGNFGSRLDSGKWVSWTDDQGRTQAYHPDIHRDKYGKG